MKRTGLVRHLQNNGCELLREGKKHSIFINLRKKKSSTVPRHTEINELLVKKICKDREIPAP